MQAMMRKEIYEKLPAIGVLCLQRPEGALDSSWTNSFLYQVHMVSIVGLEYADARKGIPLDSKTRQAVQEAVAKLERMGVVGITGDTGALIQYQNEVSMMTSTPVLLSPLLQAPLLATMLPVEEKILVVTTSAESFSAEDLKKVLTNHGLQPADTERFPLQGLDGVAGIDKLACGIVTSAEEEQIRSEIISIIMGVCQANPQIRCCLLESSLLPAYSDLIRAACGVPVFDHITVVDYVHSASSDNPRFGVQFQKPPPGRTVAEDEVMPAIGILRIDYTYPPALGDIAHEKSYSYRTLHETVKGLTFEAAQAGGPLTPEQRSSMESAIKKLEGTHNVSGLTGDCGFLIHYQKDARRISKTPCFISALLQCPLLASWFHRSEEFLVLTANGKALRPEMSKILPKCNVHHPADQKRFIVVGCEDVPGFEAVANAQKVDVEKVQPHIVKLVEKQIKQNSKIRAVLLECTELPPYADAIRLATRLPVLDAITLVDYYHSALLSNTPFPLDLDKIAQADPASQKAVRLYPSLGDSL